MNKTENVIKLIWNDNLKVSYIYSIAYLFKNCEKITEIDLSNFDASKTKYIEEMFWNCISLTSINFTNFYTPQVTQMNHLFYNCISLKELNLSDFVTNNVKKMNSMFSNCISLISLNLSNFNTSQVSMMYYMFNNCSSLKHLDISSLKIPNLNDTYNMFNYCPLLTSLDLSNFKSYRVINVYRTFVNCSSLNFVDISFFRFSNDFSYDMFSGSSNIKAINIYHAYFSDFTLKINIMEKIFQINTNIIVCGNNSFFTYINEGPLCEVNISCMNKIFYMDSSYTDFFCKTRCLNESYNNTCPEFPLENKEINNDLYNNSTSNENNNNNIFTTDIPYNEINDNRSSIFSDDIFFDHSDTIMDTTIYYDKTMSETIQNDDSNIVTFIEVTNNDPTFNNSTFINVEFITNTINSETINIISNISNSIYSELYNTTNMIIPLECYSSCKACEIEGNESNHNCLECKDNYKFELYISNYKNCYNNCSNYYMYEYNNICYNKCPENTISSKYYQCEEIINIINSTENNKSKFVENIKNELLNKINIIDIDKGNDISLTNDDLLITFSSTLNQKK